LIDGWWIVGNGRVSVIPSLSMVLMMSDTAQTARFPLNPPVRR